MEDFWFLRLLCTGLLVVLTGIPLLEAQDVTTQGQSVTSGSEEGKSDAPTDVLTKEVAPEFTFAVWDPKGKICILAKFTATFTVTYPSVDGELTASANLPEDAEAKGRCGALRQEPELELMWPGFRLKMTFTTAKAKGKPVPDSWELMTMELLYNTASPLFDGVRNVGQKTAKSLEDYPLFHTPFGKSYFCPSPDVINMYNPEKERVVLARLQDVHIQVYDVQKGKFSTFQRCSLVRIGGIPEPFAQDETVPIAVGSTLAVMAVLVIIGYALFRNIAVRKTDYSYME